jgi:hypothetical protein
MSHTAFIEDGVHLLKDPGYPSQLDRDYYKIRATDTITVAGTQYYWVQIGDDTARQKSKNELARLACDGAIFAVSVGVVAGFITVSIPEEGISGGAATPLVYGEAIAAATIVAALEKFGGDICQKFEEFFSSPDYKNKDHDGCILFKISKTDHKHIQKLKEDGIDIDQIKHIPAQKKIKQICNPKTQICKIEDL